jgi:hypothetical protein
MSRERKNKENSPRSGPNTNTKAYRLVMEAFSDYTMTLLSISTDNWNGTETIDRRANRDLILEKRRHSADQLTSYIVAAVSENNLTKIKQLSRVLHFLATRAQADTGFFREYDPAWAHFRAVVGYCQNEEGHITWTILEESMKAEGCAVSRKTLTRYCRELGVKPVGAKGGRPKGKVDFHRLKSGKKPKTK